MRKKACKVSLASRRLATSCPASYLSFLRAHFPLPLPVFFPDPSPRFL